jgi:hypothetical protein
VTAGDALAALPDSEVVKLEESLRRRRSGAAPRRKSAAAAAWKASGSARTGRVELIEGDR